MKTFPSLLSSSFLLMAMALGSAQTRAEDIDLFVGSTIPSATSLPNVLIIFDNTANWEQPFPNEKAALKSMFENLPVDAVNNAAKVRVGLMMFTETGNPDSNVDGGYVRAALRPMTPTNKTIYASLINNLQQSGDVSNGGKAGLTMAEAYRYFSAGTPRSGNNKAKTDYLGNVTTNPNWKNNTFTTESRNASKAVYALPGNAIAAFNGTQYQPPTGDGCTKNYIIYISNSAAQDNTSDITTGETMLTQAGGSTSRINISPTGSAENPSDEWARFMKTSALGVTTYTIDVNRKSTGAGPGWTALLKSMANVSEGKYYSVTVDASTGASEFSNALNAALAEILSVNSVFASVSLPVSVNTQGTFLNQVFIGMFRPDPDAGPRWNGNLKQYRLGINGSEIRLEDARGESAVNSQTGFIGECSRSYWTSATPDTYWTFKPAGVCPPPIGSPATLYTFSNSPDGSVVEKGAQAYVLRQSTARNIKTSAKAASEFTSTGGLTAFGTGNADITTGALGVTTDDQRTDLIRWSYGLDVLDENINNTDGNANGIQDLGEMRPSAHGDVVHSRPVAINLGASDTSPKVVVLYGGNDGVFRAINGNRVTAVGGVPPGGEYWSYIAPESFPILKRLMSNAPLIKFPNVTDAAAKAKDYGLDGSVSALQTGTTAKIFTTMRRGGRAIYSFSIDGANLGTPTLNWKRGCPVNLVAGTTPNDDDCPGTAWDGIGQTWSSPKIVKPEETEFASDPMLLIMGGGYDPCEDADPHTCDSNSKGRYVYVVNADTGALLNTFTTERPVVAEVALVPDLTTNLLKYAYVVDLGGNVYRINVGAAAPAAWTMTHIADLGCSTADATCNDNRKFMFAPDVIVDGDGYALMIGSGDREKPLRYDSPSVVNSVANHFYKIQDRPLDPNYLSSQTDTCGNAILCLGSLLPITGTTTPTATQLAAKKGFYLALGSQEQVVTSAITIFGTVTFSTYEPSTPDPLTCTNKFGIARVYNISSTDARSMNGTVTNSRFEQLPAVGLPPSPTAGIVRIDGDDNLDGEPAAATNWEERAFCIGCSGRSPLEAEEPPVPTLGLPTIPKSRVYWYIEK